MLRVDAPRSFDAALRDAKSPNDRVRASAAHDLARHVDEHRTDVVEVLVGLLEDDAADVRSAAALALADGHATDAVEALVARLGSEQGHVKQMILTALGEIGDARALSHVARALTDADAPTRFQAVMAHTRVCHDRDAAVSALLAATDDEDARVVHIALRMAEELGGGDQSDAPEVDERIVSRAVHLLEHPEELVCVAAAVVLGRSGRADGARVLIDVVAGAVTTTELDDEAEAIELCGALGLEEAVPSLERRAFGGVLRRDPFAWQARVALAAMEHPRAVQWVMSELDAWTRERRTLAVAAVGRARLARARAMLERFARDPSRADPRAVAEALAALDAGARSPQPGA